MKKPIKSGNKIRYSLQESLGLRLFITIMAIMIIVLLAYTVFAVVHEWQRTREELTNEGEMIVNLFANGARVGVFAENNNLLKDVAEGILAAPHVVQVAVYRGDYKLLYTAGMKSGAGDLSGDDRPRINESANRETRSNLQFVKNVTLRTYQNGEEELYLGSNNPAVTERVIGQVKVVLEKETLNREIYFIIVRNGMLALFFIAFSFMVFYISVRKITRPLERLTEKVRELGKGKDIEPITIESRDEIGRLANAFNWMTIERKLAESAVRESEQKYRALFEESINVIYITDPEGRIIDINPAGVRMFGCSEEKLRMLNMMQDLSVKHGERTAYEKMIDAQDFVRDFPVTMKKINGEELHITVTATAVRDSRGAVVAFRGMLRDVTTERNLEEQLRHAQKMEAVGRLTGGIAHDFNNILTAIVSYAYRLKVKLAKSDEPLSVYADKIVSASEKAAGLIKNMLTFSRKQIISPKPIDLNQVIRNNEDMLSRIVGENVELKISLRHDVLIINADAGQMEQVLVNFLVNARDAMPSGGSIIIETERFAMDRYFIAQNGFGTEGEYAVLHVTDTGAGIDEDIAKKIFEPFFTTKQPGKGTGLGLAIVYGIVQQHQGYVAVVSSPMSGARFTVYIPLCKDQALPATTGEQDRFCGGSETILFAEDEDEVRQVIEAVLTESGYQVISASDGEDAVRKYHQHKERINLLILDMVMPVKSGMRVYEEIRKTGVDIKAIIVSGYAPDGLSRETDIDDNPSFLSKPVIPVLLLKTVREILDRANV